MYLLLESFKLWNIWNFFDSRPCTTHFTGTTHHHRSPRILSWINDKITNLRWLEFIVFLPPFFFLTNSLQIDDQSIFKSLFASDNRYWNNNFATETCIYIYIFASCYETLEETVDTDINISKNHNITIACGETRLLACHSATIHSGY